MMIPRLILATLMVTLLFGCSNHPDSGGFPMVYMETELGDMYIVMYTNKAPVTTANFIAHVKAGDYDGASFYRVLSEDNQPTGVPKSQLIQGGIWNLKDKDVSRTTIEHEHTARTGLSHTNGTISMARQDTGTASTEFFICIDDQLGFDYGGKNNPDSQGYSAFGKVIEGMKTARAIYAQPERAQSFNPPIRIKRATLINP